MASLSENTKGAGRDAQWCQGRIGDNEDCRALTRQRRRFGGQIADAAGAKADFRDRT